MRLQGAERMQIVDTNLHDREFSANRGESFELQPKLTRSLGSMRKIQDAPLVT